MPPPLGSRSRHKRQKNTEPHPWALFFLCVAIPLPPPPNVPLVFPNRPFFFFGGLMSTDHHTDAIRLRFCEGVESIYV